MEVCVGLWMGQISSSVNMTVPLKLCHIFHTREYITVHNETVRIVTQPLSSQSTIASYRHGTSIVYTKFNTKKVPQQMLNASIYTL